MQRKLVVGALATSLVALGLRRWGPWPQRVDAEKLSETWAMACEVMLSEKAGPKQNVFLVPANGRQEAGPSGGQVPAYLKNVVVFALTAFDPPGEERTLETNKRANADLWKAINTLEPRPVDAWPTWGYNLDEGWREDGFGLAYFVNDDSSSTEQQRSAVVQLAKRFKQGGIFEFYFDGVEESLVRKTVAASLSSQVEETVRMWTVPAPLFGSNPLLSREWAGPQEAHYGLVSESARA